MSSGCDWCHTSPKGQDEALDKIRNQAKQYAIETQKNMAIFKEGNEWTYREAGSAITDGMPISEIVSFMS